MESRLVRATDDSAGTMAGARSRRMFWGINHTTLRRFEGEVITHLGYELFVPKVIPLDEANKSASVDYSYDATLTIPRADLDILNEQDYYNQPLGERQIELLNKYFDTAIIAFFPVIFDQFIRFFRGKILLRPFGLAHVHTYMDVCRDSLPADFFTVLERARNRFYFAQAFPMLSSVEHGIFLNRAITLPLGMPEIVKPDSWSGEVPRVLFVCPRINTSPYYTRIYEDFKRDFGEYPHVIAGAQPIEVTNDPSVSGFISRDTLNEWIQTHRVMYYHSTEPRHLHYHPLEAIQAGMPLVFMKESMLYELGGRDQIGACDSIAEARAKVGRLLDGDPALVAEIIRQQRRILEHFSWEYCVPEWKRVLSEHVFAEDASQPVRRRRIGVFLPVAYRGGSLNTAINQALMLKKGSEAAGEGVDVVFSYVKGDYDRTRDFHRLTENGITLRETTWREITREELQIANKFRGVESRLDAPTYIYPSDGASDFLDCDFWYLVSDRTPVPLAPMRPYSVFIADCLQRHAPDLFGDHYEAGFHATTRHAALVICMTPLNRDDLIQYVGLQERKVVQYPLEYNPLPRPSEADRQSETHAHPYFIWPTNTSPHKNHETALRGIRRYFERLDGKLDIVVTGVETDKFDPKAEPGEVSPYVDRIRQQLAKSKSLSTRISWAGNVEQDEFASILSHAQFLFHPTLLDAGTLATVEAAGFGVPTLSNDYPPMRYYEQRFKLGISFFDGTDERTIALALKDAETRLPELKRRLPGSADLAQFSLDNLAPSLWKLVRQHVQ